MLKIYDKNHTAIGHIIKYRDLQIESDAKTGDKTLLFTYLARYHEISEEYYVEDRENEYVIKEKSVSSDGFLQFVAVLNVEDLEAKPWSSFSIADATLEEAAKLALAGSGWTVGECNISKRRNAGILQTNTLGVIQKLCTAFMCEPVYDTKKKTVSFYEQAGEDKGTFFLSGLNLKRLQRKGSSYDYYTKIIPIGQDGLTIESVNDGKNYLENFQYSPKIKTYIWKDESYTDAQALKEDATAKLEDLSKPQVSYSADIIDLASQRTEYKDFSFSVGDTITLIDAATGIREKQRIIKLTQYPQDHTKDTCELANKIPSFEETQEKLQAAQEIINTVISDDGRYTGTIKVSDILKFEEGVAGTDAVTGILGMLNTLDGSLSKLKLTVGQIESNYIKAEDADLKYAKIDFANIGKATMEWFYAESGLIKNVSIGDAEITGRLMGVTISGDLIEGNTIIADKLLIKGKDGLYYRLNTDGATIEAEQTDYNSLNGQVIMAKSVTANKISVQDLVAFGATIAGLHITEKAIYSGVKETVDNLTRGLYIDYTGQVAIGDETRYIKYYMDASGSQKLLVAADTVIYGKDGKDLETAITAAQKKADEGWQALADLCVEGDMTIIDGAHLATGSVTAVKINVKDLFAQDITASGSISGIKVSAREITADSSYYIFNGSNSQKILYYDGGNILLGKMGTGSSIANGAGFEFLDKSINVYGNLDFLSGSITTPGKITGNGGIVTAADVTASSNMVTHDNFLADNNHGLYIKDTGGAYKNTITVNTSDQVLVGAGHAWAKKGQLCLMGSSITMYDSLRNVWWTPYYVPGSSFVFRWRGAGYITASGVWVCFFIPFDRPVVGVSAVEVGSNPGLMVRQNNKYLYGSSASAWAHPTEYTATLTQGGAYVTAKMPNSTNATNNSPCGIEAAINVYFS